MSRRGLKGKAKDFDFNELVGAYELAEENIDLAARNALIEVFHQVQKDASKTFASHRKRGVVEKALLDNPIITYSAGTISTPLGYQIRGGPKGSQGFVTIFLMFGTPKIRPNRELWSIFFGKEFDDRVEASIANHIFKNYFDGI